MSSKSERAGRTDAPLAVETRMSLAEDIREMELGGSSLKAVKRKRLSEEQTPMQRALALLVRREHSRKELARKLAVRGVVGEEADLAIERLAAEGWQSDLRFGELLVRTRAAQGYGPIRIRAELGTHGLDGAAIQASMDTFEGDWMAAAHAQVQRRFGARIAADPSQRHKAADFLYRRGFDGDMVRSALKADLED